METVRTPERRTYRGPITDTRRWDEFRSRPDDVFICTPAKCGTTWTQAICAALIFGRPDHGRHSGQVSPWVDANFTPVEECLAEVDAQEHRRYLKTHTPFDGVPYRAECTYLVVLRDPRDAFLSGQDHRANLVDRDLAQSTFPGGDDAFVTWLATDHDPEAWDFWTLDTKVHFFRSYWEYRQLPNLHFFHYSDMARDRHGAVARVADAIGVQYDDAEIAAFAEGTSFEAMKERAEQFAPEAGRGFWHADAQFFSRASLGRWAEAWSSEQIAAFDARIQELLPGPERHWLLDGGPLPS